MTCRHCGHSLFNHHADPATGQLACWECEHAGSESGFVCRRDGPAIIVPALAKELDVPKTTAVKAVIAALEHAATLADTYAAGAKETNAMGHEAGVFLATMFRGGARDPRVIDMILSRASDG